MLFSLFRQSVRVVCMFEWRPKACTELGFVAVRPPAFLLYFSISEVCLHSIWSLEYLDWYPDSTGHLFLLDLADLDALLELLFFLNSPNQWYLWPCSMLVHCSHIQCVCWAKKIVLCRLGLQQESIIMPFERKCSCFSLYRIPFFPLFISVLFCCNANLHLYGSCRSFFITS